MASGNYQAPTGDDGADAGEDGAGDLGAALAQPDTGFVVEGGKKSLLTPGTMLMAGLLAACGAGMYFMSARSGPQAAAASKESAAANTTINQFLQGDAQNVQKMKQLLQNTEKVVQQFQADPAKTQVPVEELKTNPFRLKAPDADKEEKAEQLEALAAAKKLEEERAAVLKSVQDLRLQSILHPSGAGRKGCMVNNKLYTEGQAVQGFTVEKINPKSVVVRSGAYRFELRMQP